MLDPYKEKIISPFLFLDITLIVDPKATLAIIGTEMDFVKDKLKSEFVFTNPNAKGTCGCGESFNL